MNRQAEAVGCWLWDHYRGLALGALSVNMVVVWAVNGFWDGSYAGRGPVAVVLALMSLAWSFGTRAEIRRRKRPPSVRLVVDLSPNTYDELMHRACEQHRTITELIEQSAGRHTELVDADRYTGMTREVD